MQNLEIRFSPEPVSDNAANERMDCYDVRLAIEEALTMRNVLSLPLRGKPPDDGKKERREQPSYRIDEAQIAAMEWSRSDRIPTAQWLGELRRIVAQGGDEDA